MALAKLWTALFGKRNEGKQEAPATTVAPVAKNTARASDTGSTKAPVAVVPLSATTKIDPQAGRTSRSTASPKSSGPAAERAVSRTGHSGAKRKANKKVDGAVPLPAIAVVPELPIKQFQRRNTAWTKRLGATSVTSILDLCNADTSHMVELLESVVDSNSPAPKYIAINQFELGEQGLSLQQFHKRVRTLGGVPVAIPMTLSDGLRRLSQTIGTVDLVLLNDASLWSEAELSKLFKRVVRASTLVFVKDAKGQWQALPNNSASHANHAHASVKASQPAARSSQPDRSRKAA